MTFPALMLAATVSLPLAGAARLPAASTADLDPVWIKVAAAGSSAAAKAHADFVCKGTNDQDTLQLALDRCKMEERDLFLFNGVYMIDAFSERADKGPRAAVCIPNMKRYFVMKGQSFFQAGWNTSPSNGVILYARSSIWPTAGDPYILVALSNELGGRNNEAAEIIRQISSFVAEHAAKQ